MKNWRHQRSYFILAEINIFLVVFLDNYNNHFASAVMLQQLPLNIGVSASGLTTAKSEQKDHQHQANNNLSRGALLSDVSAESIERKSEGKTLPSSANVSNPKHINEIQNPNYFVFDEHKAVSHHIDKTNAKTNLLTRRGRSIDSLGKIIA